MYRSDLPNMTGVVSVRDAGENDAGQTPAGSPQVTEPRGRAVAPADATLKIAVVSLAAALAWLLCLAMPGSARAICPVNRPTCGAPIGPIVHPIKPAPQPNVAAFTWSLAHWAPNG